MDASKVIPVCVAAVAIVVMPFAIALIPSFMTLASSSAFKTSANTDVLSPASCASFPKSSTTSPHSSADVSASCMHLSFSAIAAFNSVSSSSALLQSRWYRLTLSPVFCTTFSCASYCSLTPFSFSDNFSTSSLFAPYTVFAFSISALRDSRAFPRSVSASFSALYFLTTFSCISCSNANLFFCSSCSFMYTCCFAPNASSESLLSLYFAVTSLSSL